MEHTALKQSPPLLIHSKNEAMEALRHLSLREKLNPLEFHKLFPRQKLIRDDPAKTIVTCGGNRAGKTELIADIILRQMIAVPRTKVWASAETFQDSVAIQQLKIWELVPKDQIKYGYYDDINGFRNRKLKLTNSSLLVFKCHARGQRVLMWDGSVKDIFNVDIGEMVRCFDGGTKKVINKFLYKKAIINNIQTVGHLLKVTPNHRLWVRGKGWVLADSIKSGDIIECANFPGGVQSVSNWKPYVLALMISEGCTRGKSPDFTTGSDSVIKAVSEVLPNDIFVKKISMTSCPLAYRLSSRNQYSNRIKQYLDEVGLWNKLSYDKFIPPEVFTWNASSRKQFIEMLFACDGTVKRLEARYTTASEQLARDVQALLWTFNIHANVKKMNNKHFYVSMCSGQRKRFDVFDVIGKPIKYNPKFMWLNKEPGTVLSNYRGEKRVDVCCLEIEDSHEMIVEGVRSHNSYDQGREAYQGDKIDINWFDEEPPYDIYREARMRLIDRNGQMIISMTALKGLTDLVNEILEDAENVETMYAPHVHEELPRILKKGPIKIYTLWTTENKQIDQNRVKEEIELMTKDEIKVRIYGIPTAMTGKIYPMFNKDVHCVTWDFIPKTGVCLYHILDPHDIKPWAMQWWAVHKTGSAYLVHEYPFRADFNAMQSDDKSYAEYVEIIKNIENILVKSFGRSVSVRIIDPNFGHKTVKLAERVDNTGLTTAVKELAKRGMRFRDAVDDIEEGHLQVRKWLMWKRNATGEIVQQPKLYLYEECKNSINHISKYSRKDIIAADGDVKAKVQLTEKWKDFSDCLRYMTMFNPRYIPREQPKTEFTESDRRY